MRIRGAHYCHAFCAERTPGARLVDPLAAVEPLETAVTAKSEEALTVEGDAGTRKTGGKASKAKECSTFKAKVASVEEMGVVEVEEGDDEESASAGGGGTWSKRPAKSAVAGKVPRGGGAASGAGTGVGRGKAAFACAMTAETKCIPKVSVQDVTRFCVVLHCGSGAFRSSSGVLPLLGLVCAYLRAPSFSIWQNVIFQGSLGGVYLGA